MATSNHRMLVRVQETDTAEVVDEVLETLGFLHGKQWRKNDMHEGIHKGQWRQKL